MNMKRIATLIFVFPLFFIACKDSSTKDYKPESIGPINQLAVVMEIPLWQGPVGDKVREIFAAPVVGMPQEEPLFNLENIPPQVFKGTTINSRSILFVSVDTVNVAHVRTDVYARPQKIGVIEAPTESELIANLERMGAEMIAEFKAVELGVKQRAFLKSLSKERELTDKFGVTMKVPSVYKVGKQDSNFVWIDRQIPRGTMNLLVYTLPRNYFRHDSTLVKDIVRMRDSIGEKYVPGPDVPGKITYMRTEPAFSPAVFNTEIDGRKAIEVRGIWDVSGYPMAGPFLTYIIPDGSNSRLLVLEGFTFAPATAKRDDMFELEAIMKTVDFKNPDSTRTK